jgi:type 2A phosphatase activator TIP41
MLAATRDDIPAFLRDANRLSEILPVVEHRTERVVLGG